jgi:hypothetical protein
VVQEDIEGVPPETPELRLAALLSEYSELRAARLESAPKRAQSTSKLLLTNLQQRLFSSIRAFGRTLEAHRKTVLRRFEEASPAAGKVNVEDLSAPPPMTTWHRCLPTNWERRTTRGRKRLRASRTRRRRLKRSHRSSFGVNSR